MSEESWTNVTSACELPDGTQVEHEGEVYTALPQHEIAGRTVRWHSDATVTSDRGMDVLLDDGAKVIGRDEQAVAEFVAALKGNR